MLIERIQTFAKTVSALPNLVCSGLIFMLLYHLLDLLQSLQHQNCKVSCFCLGWTRPPWTVAPFSYAQSIPVRRLISCNHALITLIAGRAHLFYLPSYVIVWSLLYERSQRKKEIKGKRRCCRDCFARLDILSNFRDSFRHRPERLGEVELRDLYCKQVRQQNSWKVRMYCFAY